MSYGVGGSVVLLGLLPHQLVDHGLFAEAAVAMKLVHVGHWRVRVRGCYMAPREKRRIWIWLECVCISVSFARYITKKCQYFSIFSCDFGWSNDHADSRSLQKLLLCLLSVGVHQRLWHQLHQLQTVFNLHQQLKVLPTTNLHANQAHTAT